MRRARYSPASSLTAASLSLVALAIASPSLAAGCVAPSQAEVAALHDRWIQSLATMHPDKVLRNYAPDATLVGLESPKVLGDTHAIRNYFVYFLQREPKIDIESRFVRTGCDTASDVGTMTVEARPKGQAPFEPLHIRYSINYENRDGHWLIVQHHLSVAEKPAPAASTAAAPAAKAPAVAGFVKRLPAPKRTAAPAAKPDDPQTEQLQGGWTYTPARWPQGESPRFLGD